MLDAEELRRLVNYDCQTGVFTWKARAENYATSQRFAGKKSGCPSKSGYLRMMVNGKLYYCHRLAWLYMTGRWPKADIDHINRNRSDNRWCNLREASRSQNNVNAGMRKNNTSGLKGAFFCQDKKKQWQAKIGLNGKGKHLGYFNTKEEAHAAYLAAARATYGEFLPDSP